MNFESMARKILTNVKTNFDYLLSITRLSSQMIIDIIDFFFGMFLDGSNLTECCTYNFTSKLDPVKKKINHIKTICNKYLSQSKTTLKNFTFMISLYD